jgi:hypothetical protein
MLKILDQITNMLNGAFQKEEEIVFMKTFLKQHKENLLKKQIMIWMIIFY